MNPTRMRIVQTVFGVFHHFELARELEHRSHLQTIYSTWPWTRLKREGLPRHRVRTFPSIHMAEMALNRSPLRNDWLSDELGYLNALAFDEWTSRQLAKAEPQPDALIGISGSSLKTGRELQRRGGIFVCDRGSSHQRFQQTILGEEYRRWGLAKRVSDPRDTAREEELYAMADAITVPSSFSARSFAEMGVPSSKVHLIPYGVMLDRFHRTTPQPEISERFEVVFAGQVSIRKGVPYLLEAFARLEHPNKRLRLMGPLEPELKSILHRFPAASVEFVGPVSQEVLASVMGSSHVLVLPSIEDGFGLVMGQAMACGCPVIASTNTGGSDLLTHEAEGYIVPIRDADAIRTRLQALIDTPGLHQSLSTAALARVQQLGGWTHYGDGWETLLHRLTGR